MAPWILPGTSYVIPVYLNPSLPYSSLRYSVNFFLLEQFKPWFPAAETTVTPFLIAYSIALLYKEYSAVSGVAPP